MNRGHKKINIQNAIKLGRKKTEKGKLGNFAEKHTIEFLNV